MTPLLAQSNQGESRAHGRPAAGITAHGVAYRPGLTMALHAHSRATMSLIVSGSLTDHAGGASVECRPLTLIYKPAGAEHATTVEAAGARTIVFEFDGEVAAPAGNRCLWLAGGAATARFLELVHALRGQSSAADLDALLDALRATTPPSSRSAPHELRQAAAWIGSGVPTQTVAARLGLHRATLHRRFRACFGAGPRAWRRQRRVSAAAAELAEPGRPLAELALGLGFADQAHLTRAFRQATGVTPARYRRLVTGLGGPD